MGKVIGSGNICIARLSDGYSNAVVMLYRTSESSERPLRMLYNFSTGELSSGVDGKTLTECLNGWSTERGAESHYAISASVRSTEEYGTIESSSWSDSFLIAEKGETIVSVILYQRAENAPEKPSSALTYNFYTGEVTGSLGAWSTSIPDYTEYPLWSISATASAVLDGGTETDEIGAAEWSTPKKVAEDGKSPIEIFLSAYSYVFPADEDGLVKSSEYEKFSVEVLAVRGGKAVEFTMSAELTGITNVAVSGNTVSASSSSVMLGDSASVKLSITAEGETYIKTISLAKAKQSKPTELWFAWSKSESIFTPKDSNFWIVGTSFIYFNNSLIGNIPFTNSWVNNWAEIEAAKTEEYCYLWCKTSESGTPFLFTGATGKTGACTMYQYALGDAEGNTPADSDFSDTMPTIQGTGKMLWTRYKVIPAGGLAGDVEWSEAKLVGTDNSEVYAKISENATAITEITKSGGLIEQAITEYDTETGETMRTSISQTADKIAMKVGDSGTVTDKDGNTLAGIVISDGKVVLQGDMVIEKGSLTGDTFTSTNLITGKTFEVNNGGAIQSANYEPYTINSDGTVTKGKGFKLTGDTGVIEANEMILGDDIVFGGTVLNDVITTRKEEISGTTITSPSFTQNCWKGSDLYSAVRAYIPSRGTLLDDRYIFPVIYNGKTYAQSFFGTTSGGVFIYLRNNKDVADGYAQYEADTISGDSLLITINNSVIVQCGPLYSSWVGLSAVSGYGSWPNTGYDSLSGTIESGTFEGTNVAGKTVTVTSHIITVSGVGSLTEGETYTESEWPSYNITIKGEGKGVLVTAIYPKDGGDKNLGSSSNKFNQLWAQEIHASNLIDLIYPVGSIYISMKNTSPASFLGGSWTKLDKNNSFWIQDAGAEDGGTDLSFSKEVSGLPDIIGFIESNNEWSIGNNDTVYENGSTGALYAGSFAGYASAGKSNYKTYMSKIVFEASRANSIYGKTNYVRPPAYKIFAWRRTA